MKEFPILEALADVLAPRLAPLVAAELRRSPDGWIDQTQTRLGRRNHIDLVRQLLAAGESDKAARRGKLYCLRVSVHDEAFTASGRSSARPVAKATAPDPEDSEVDDVRRILGVTR